MKKNITIMIMLIASGVYLSCNGVVHEIAQKLPRSMTKEFSTEEEARAYNKKIENTALAGAALLGAYKLGSWAYKKWTHNDAKHIDSLFEKITKLSNELYTLGNKAIFTKNISTDSYQKLIKAKSIGKIVKNAVNLYFLDTIPTNNEYSTTLEIKNFLNEEMKDMKIVPIIKSNWSSRIYNIWARDNLRNIDHLLTTITNLAHEVTLATSKGLARWGKSDLKEAEAQKANNIAYIVKRSILLYSSDTLPISNQDSVINIVDEFLDEKIKSLTAPKRKIANVPTKQRPQLATLYETVYEEPLMHQMQYKDTDSQPTKEPLAIPYQLTKKQLKNKAKLPERKEKLQEKLNKIEEEKKKNPPRYTREQIAQKNLIGGNKTETNSNK